MELETDVNRRKVPRIFMSKEQLKLVETGKVFSVADLSPEGLSLRILDSEDLLTLTLGRSLKGTLNLGGQKVEVEVKVSNVRKEIVGCEFVDLSKPARKQVEAFLDPAELGVELRAMPGFEQSGLWYHGARGTDFLIWRSADGEFKRFQLYVLGFFVEWGEESGLRTGKTKPGQEPAEVYGLIRLESLLLETDAKPDAAKLEFARLLIDRASFSSEVKRKCLRWIASGQSA